MSYPALILKRREQARIEAGHLWVFSNEVDTARSPLAAFQAGDPATLKSHDGRALGTVYVNPASLICARLVSRRPDAAMTADWFARRIARARDWRRVLAGGEHYRLVYSEGDGLPGLTVDRYGEHLVVQITTAGMERRREAILEALAETLRPASIYLRNTAAVRELEGLALGSEQALGETPAHTVVSEHGLAFEVALAGGQKTGWFFDQRENRGRLDANMAAGRRVLDAFSYVGAWGLRAARLGAAEVTLVDDSAAAIALAERNAGALAPACPLTALTGDAFETLAALGAAGRTFDLVIIDPPAFVKRRRDLAAGRRAYERLTGLALALCAPQAILVAASCSALLPARDFQSLVRRAAGRQHRRLRIVGRGGLGADHPVHPAMAETDYLKCLFCTVDQ